MTAGCGNYSGIITGGKTKRRFQPLLKRRRFQTFKKPVIGKKRLNRRYINTRGGCPCNQTGGYTFTSKPFTSKINTNKHNSRNKKSKDRNTTGGSLQISGLPLINPPFGNVYV